MQTLLQLDIWLQSYEGFDNAENSIKQRNLNTVCANISKTTSLTSDSFLLIMSQILLSPLFFPISPQDDSSSMFRAATMFLLAFTLAVVQSYLLIYSGSMKSAKCLIISFISIMANFYLYVHGLRYAFTGFFHIVVLLAAAFQIIQGPNKIKLPDYSV